MAIRIIDKDNVDVDFEGIKSVFIVIPYSDFDDDVKSFNKRLADDNDVCLTKLVDNFISEGVFNVYICLFDIDKQTRNNILAKAGLNNHEYRLKILFNVFTHINNGYCKKNYIPCIYYSYIRTRNGISKAVLTHNIFVSSRRKSKHFDGRKTDILFNQDIRLTASKFMDNVKCGVLTPIDFYNDIDINTTELESVYERTLYDTVHAAFINVDNAFAIII